MTEEYKKNVLKYLTGNLPEESSINSPQFKNIKTTLNNLKTQIRSYFSSTVAYVDIISPQTSQNQDLNYSVIACRGELIGQSNISGAFVIVDKDFNLIDIITRYDDGTFNGMLIGLLYCMNVDKDGNFYVAEAIADNVYDNKRIIVLNNLLIKPVNSNNYKAVIKEIHEISFYRFSNIYKIFKNDNGKKFLIVGVALDETTLTAEELTIGKNKTWKSYNANSTHYGKQWLYQIFDNGYNVYWDSDNKLHFSIAGYYYGLVILKEPLIEDEGETSFDMRQIRYLNTDSPNQLGNFIFYSNKIGYYAFAIDNDPVVNYYIYKVDLETKQTTLIYENTGQWSSYSAIWLFKNNTTICYRKLDLESEENNTYSLSFGLIDDISVYEIPLGEITATYYLESFCYSNIISNFNTNYIYIQNQDTLFSLEFDWNDNNYNGQSYTSSASLIPNKVTLNNTNNNEIFNRNIYNLSNYGNWYTASVNIPNSYFNSTTLHSANLYSQANNLLTSNNIDITKNIYEELNINFINSFVIYDKLTNTKNYNASNLFVDAMLNKYNQKYLGKIRINYKDGSPSVVKTIDTKNLQYKQYTIDGKNYWGTDYIFIVYMDNRFISTIDFISYDEEITYCTKKWVEADHNTYYQLIERVYIQID